MTLKHRNDCSYCCNGDSIGYCKQFVFKSLCFLLVTAWKTFKQTSVRVSLGFNIFQTPDTGDWAIHRLWVTVRLQEKDRMTHMPYALLLIREGGSQKCMHLRLSPAMNLRGQNVCQDADLVMAWLRERPEVNDTAQLWLYSKRGEGKSTRCLEACLKRKKHNY